MESFQCSDISTVVLLLFFFFQNFNSAALTYVCLELFYCLQCRFLLSKIIVFVVSRQHTLILWTFNFVLQVLNTLIILYIELKVLPHQSRSQTVFFTPTQQK